MSGFGFQENALYKKCIRYYVNMHIRNKLHFLHTYPAMKEQTECSETLAYKIQTPGNYPEESTQHSEHGISLKSSTFMKHKKYYSIIIEKLRIYLQFVE